MGAIYLRRRPKRHREIRSAATKSTSEKRNADSWSRAAVGPWASLWPPPIGELNLGEDDPAQMTAVVHGIPLRAEWELQTVGFIEGFALGYAGARGGCDY